MPAETLPAAVAATAPLLTRQEAAEFLTDHGYKIGWRRLATFAVTGGGPAYRRWGRNTLYDRNDLLAWAEQRAGAGKRRSTSEVVA